MGTPILRVCALCLLVLALAGCGSPPPVAEVLPRTVPGGWTLDQAQPVDLASLPPNLRERSPESAVRATYRGPASVTVLLCRFRADASAFALMQSWSSRESAQPFYQGPYFGTAEGAAPAELLSFVRAFQPLLPR